MRWMRRWWMALHQRIQQRLLAAAKIITRFEGEKVPNTVSPTDTFEKFLQEFRDHSADAEERQRPRKRAS